MKTSGWTSKDLEAFPDQDGKRYEIIDGELYISKQPHFNHQIISSEISAELVVWNRIQKLGRVSTAPGLIFSEDDDAAPDLTWISNERIQLYLQNDGHLHGAPELVIEILSPGSTNESRDRDVKRKLYSRRGATEYWVVDWRTRSIEIYRRDTTTDTLQQFAVLDENATLTSPTLPGFSCTVARIFAEII
jgi:Uma2 family endonuclease